MLYRVFILACVIGSAWAQAVDVANIYTVEVGIANQQASARGPAMEKGLLKVLVRASGASAAVSNDYIRANLAKASSFVQQYAYSLRDINPDSSAVGESLSRYRLKLVFEPSAIQRLLTDAGLPVWSNRRPLVLVWLAEQTKGKRHLLGSSSTDGALLKQLADDRAVPIILPLMDLEDVTALDVTDVWGRFSGPVVKASRRYAADVVVFGRIQQVGARWRADIQWILDGERGGMTLTAASRKEILTQLVSRITDRLAAKYGVLASLTDANELRIEVSGLDTIVAAAKAEQYLFGLLPVRAVDMERLEHNVAIFRLRLVSRKDAVLEAISLDTALRPLSNRPSIGLGPQAILYRFHWSS